MRYKTREGRHGGGHEHHERHERGGRGRMRHGEVRAALLLALQEGAGHGYELGQRLERQSGGTWSPSAGSIYPNLQRLSDEGLVTSEERDGKRIYVLTRRGLAELKDRSQRGETAPWEAIEGGGGELREAVVALKHAAKQISLVGTDAQRKRATEVVVEARRQIYELLAKG